MAKSSNGEDVVQRVEGSSATTIALTGGVEDLAVSPDGSEVAIVGDRRVATRVGDHFEDVPQLGVAKVEAAATKPVDTTHTIDPTHTFDPHPDAVDRDTIVGDGDAAFDRDGRLLTTRDFLALSKGSRDQDSQFRFSPDYRHIVFSSTRDGGRNLYVMTATGDDVHAITVD